MKLATQMQAAQARKLRISDTVRALVMAQNGERYVYSKDYFESGRTSQVFAGLGPQGQTVVLKRLSFLEPGAGNLRAILREKGQRADTLTPQDVANELAMMRQAGGVVGEQAKVLFTARTATGALSKALLVLPPAHADVLGHIHALAHRSDQVRLQVTGEILAQLSEQLGAFHGQGLVHCDIRPENLLSSLDAQLRPQVYMGDFGFARRLSGAALTAARKQDAHALGLVGLMLLMPEHRTDVANKLDAARQRCAARFAPLQPAIEALLAGDVAAATAHLVQRPPPPASAEVAAHWLGVRDKKDEITARIDTVRAHLAAAGVAAGQST